MLKKMMLAGLMTATVLGGIAPAYAQRGDDGGWRGRGERSGQSDGDRRGGDGQRAQRWEQRRAEQPTARADQPRVEQRWQGNRERSGDAPRPTWRNEARGNDRAERPQWRDDRRGEVRQEWRGSWRDYNREGRDNRDGRDNREGRWRDNDGRRWSGNVESSRRYTDRTRWSSQRRWDSGWRDDRRYDWRSYRSRYSDRYRIGRYYAPRGWDYGYSRFSIGIYLNSLLFANNYWIDDPWSYRLPPAYGTLRWIRYYDDALLVDIRDGYVVDVIHDFFY